MLAATATTARPGVPDRDALSDAAMDLTAPPSDLLARVAALIAEPASSTGFDVARRGMGGTKITGSPAPWWEPAADLYYKIHAATREAEADLRRGLGYADLPRRGSTGATMASIKALPDLILAAEQRRPGNVVARAATLDLLAWAVACRRLLDEARDGEEPWTRAPGGLACHECERPLYLRPGWQYETAPDLYCRACRDTEGRLLAWPAAERLGLLQ